MGRKRVVSRGKAVKLKSSEAAHVAAQTAELVKQVVDEIRLLKEEIAGLKRFLSNQLCSAPDEKRFLTLKEAASYSGMSPEQIRRYVKNGVLNRYGSTRRILIDKMEFEAAIRSGLRKAVLPGTRSKKDTLTPIKVELKSKQEALTT